MKVNKKITSFTLPEILVILLISAIVVGLAFSVLHLVQQNYNSIRKNYRISTEVQHLQQQLNLDFNRYRKITFNKDQQTLNFSHQLDSVFYSFKDDIIFRKKDTIALVAEEFIFYFNGLEVSSGPIDALKLRIGGEAKTQLFIYKVNDAKTYVTANGN